MSQSINVGLIGYKFMGKAHSNAYMKVGKFFELDTLPVMKAVCGRDEKGVAEFAKTFGWEGYATSWHDMVTREDIDLVDISAPSNVHCEIAVAAAQAGKHVYCEKPLAFTLEQARQMLTAVREAGVTHMVNFNYRRVPALALAKQLIDAGELGEIRHFRGTYLQDWINDPDFAMNWRLRKEVAGSGAHGDLNSHLTDLARFLVGEVDEVVGMNKTFIKQRPAEGVSTGLTAVAGEGTEEVTVDDCTMFLARFANGALGTFEATRLAPGRKNFNRIEINGSLGSLVFTFEDMNVLEFYSVNDKRGQQGFRKILATEDVHPYMEAWWPPGHVIGYEHTFVNAAYDLLAAIGSGTPATPDFQDGAQCMAVLETVDRSIEERNWMKVPAVT